VERSTTFFEGVEKSWNVPQLFLKGLRGKDQIGMHAYLIAPEHSVDMQNAHGVARRVMPCGIDSTLDHPPVDF
jgi:hypothetical protein